MTSRGFQPVKILKTETKTETKTNKISKQNAEISFRLCLDYFFFGNWH